MLKLMRDSFHQLKWILLAIVAAFIIGFVYVDMGLGGAGRSNADDASYAARVNGQTITLREYERALDFTQKNYEQAYKQPLTQDMINQMGLPKQVLDSLIDERLMLQEARRLHLSATPEEVRKKISEIPIFYENGKFIGTDLYTRYVTGPMGYASPAEFEEELAREVTVNKLVNALSNSVVVSPKAVEAEYRRISENAKIRYVLYPAVREMASVTLAPGEVEKYYAAHSDKYAHGEQRAIKYLIADTTLLRQKIHPTDAELKKRYDAVKETQFATPQQAHILHILIKVDPNASPADDAAAKAKADSLVAQLRAGADFATLAKANSGDPSSSFKGGDMGWVDKGSTVEPFDTAAFNIPLNTISDPIRSKEYGYHIIKVLERRDAGFRPFNEVRPILEAQVIDQTSKDMARDEIARVAARIKASKPKSPEAFSAMASGDVSSNDSQWFAKSDPISGIGNNPAVSAWAFAAKQGDVSEIIGTNRGPIVAYVYGIRPAGITPLADIKAKVESDAKMEKARAAALQVMRKAMPAASVDAVAQKVGANATETTVTRQGYVSGFQGDTSALVDAAMSAKVGQVVGPVAVGDGAVVLQVLDQKKVDAAALKQNEESYSNMLRAQEARNLRQVLLQRLRKQADVKYNIRLLEQQSKTQQQS